MEDVYIGLGDLWVCLGGDLWVGRLRFIYAMGCEMANTINESNK